MVMWMHASVCISAFGHKREGICTLVCIGVVAVFTLYMYENADISTCITINVYKYIYA